MAGFYLFAVYAIVLAIITLVLIFRPMNKWVVILLIAAWLPVAIWVISFLLILAASPTLLKCLAPFIAIFVGIFVLFKLMNQFISGR
ncbi:MAG: hypothetical protein ACETVX_05030 [bacterium]